MFDPIAPFDLSKIPDVSDEQNFHDDATYVFQHLASEVVPGFNSVLADLNVSLNQISAEISGAGAGLNAGTLEGYAAAQFVRSDADTALTANLNVDVQNGGALYFTTDANIGFVPMPGGGQRRGAASETGAIKIKLPTNGAADMVKFAVDIYDYEARASVTMFISGYSYQPAGHDEWMNCSVQTIASDSARDYPVRFGADASGSCVWIGDLTKTWTWTQVSVRDVMVGHSANAASYAEGWSIDIVQSFDAVDETLTGNLPAANTDQLDGRYARSGARTDDWFWLRLNSTNPPLRVTQQGTGRIAEFHSGANDGVTKSFIANDGAFQVAQTGPVVRAAGGNPLITQHTARGGAAIGADDVMVVGSGASAATTAANVDMEREYAYLTSDAAVFLVSNLQGGWAGRHTAMLDSSGRFTIDGNTAHHSGLGAGAVGTYMFADATDNANHSFGQLYAGSNLKPSDSEANDVGAAQTGTWRCMGNSSGEATLYLRIA